VDASGLRAPRADGRGTGRAASQAFGCIEGLEAIRRSGSVAFLRWTSTSSRRALAALFGRTASRDLFDVRELLAAASFDTERLRLGFVVYGGINRRDWRVVSLDEVQADPRDVERRPCPCCAPEWGRPLLILPTGAKRWSPKLATVCPRCSRYARKNERFSSI
jgi:hypothetical protein